MEKVKYRSIGDYKFEIEFGLINNIITLKVCEHFQLQAYASNVNFVNKAVDLVNREDKCPVCGKGV